jgi:hypothetical protein
MTPSTRVRRTIMGLLGLTRIRAKPVRRSPAEPALREPVRRIQLEVLDAELLTNLGQRFGQELLPVDRQRVLSPSRRRTPRVRVAEKTVTYNELLGADEVFLTNSLAEILRGVGRERTVDETTELVRSILATASLAAMDVAEAGPSAPVAPALRELQDSTRRATELCWLIKELTAN